jgi:hypothetical protein
VLVVGTALTESELRYVDQVDKANKPGPAFGLWQHEGPTHYDDWHNFLRFNRDLKWKVTRLASHFSGDYPDPGELVFNMRYACAMARIHYRRFSAALPPVRDAIGMATYWKTHFNTKNGKGTVAKGTPHFDFAIHLEV